MEPGVVVVHNLPKDFAERELKDYFKQFGPVTRLRVSRSRKTRGTRGYAYVEFQCKDVAEIAANSMNNYLMFGRSLKCELLPSDRVHRTMFNGSQQNQITTVARHKSLVNRTKSTSNLATILKRRKKMLKASQTKLAQFGIKFQPVVINCPDMNILEIEDMKPEVEKSSKLKKKGTKKPEVLPLETITLKSEKRLIRNRV